MKAYIYFMGRRSSTGGIFASVCAGKAYDESLCAQYKAQTKPFELVECPIAENIADIFACGNIAAALRTDGTAVDWDGEVFNLPPVMRAEHLSITGESALRGVDGKLYNTRGEEISQNYWIARKNRMAGTSVGTEKGCKIAYAVPRARLTAMDPNFAETAMETQYRYDGEAYIASLYKDAVQAESERILFGEDITLFAYNGNAYKLEQTKFLRRREILDTIACLDEREYPLKNLHLADAAYTQEYDLDDIAQLVARNIYVNRKGKIVLMDGWDDLVQKDGFGVFAYSCEIAKAQKWSGVVHCETMQWYGGQTHLVAKTEDGHLLTTFDADMGKSLQNIRHAFIRNDFAVFVTE